MKETIKDLEDLFTKATKLKVPSYQRAYAWEEEQLNQFVSDMLEMKDKGVYYYGHFILEKTNDGFEIIDGQQRLITFILFLIVCKLFKMEGFEDYINKFEIVNYDREAFETIQKKLNDANIEWKKEDFELTSEQTLSIQRIIFAINYFIKLFKGGKSKLKLDPAEIDNYVKTFTKSHISTHITYGKAVAVQIFELQNTRGVKLNLIEKVKSKLMKAVYLYSESEEAEDKIKAIQNEFAKIYQLEEQADLKAFRGELSLEDILLHHLRIIDDGTKLKTNNKNLFNSPRKDGNKEEVIFNYIDERIKENLRKSKQDVVDYIISLSNKFSLSVHLVSEELAKYDETNHLIGDVLILDKWLSLEFFILLSHLDKKDIFGNKELVRFWEKLLFTRDFHGKYYQQQKRDDFGAVFFEIAKDADKLEAILNKYIVNGFRCELMDDKSLPKTVSNFIVNNKGNILNNAFYWCTEKMVYVLYKYEISQDADLNMLRKIMKEGRSVEHILPQEWQWDWIGEKDSNNVSDDGKKTNDEVKSVINGLGNLLLITKSENSSKGNNHPSEKNYESCNGGSYSKHNNKIYDWGSFKNWRIIINTRGEEIFGFMQEFIK